MKSVHRHPARRSFLMAWALCLLALSTAGLGANRGRLAPSQTKSIPVSKGGLLKVALQGGDIRITPWDKNEVFVKVRGADSEDFDRLTMTSSGNAVYVQSDGRGGWSGDTRVDISVPDEFNLDLQTSDGNLEVDGSLKGSVRGSTSAGDVRIGAVNGTVDLSTSGGNIHTGDIQGDLTLATAGGDITVGTAGGEAEITTSGGNITAKSVRKSVSAKTAGGDIRIGDVGGEASLSTSGGNVTAGKVAGSAKLTTAGGDVTIRGANGHVQAKTAGGNLTLSGIIGSIEGVTAGGDIEAELAPKSSEGVSSSRLATAGGTVRLFVPEDAKATISATIRLDDREGPEEIYKVRSSFKSQTYEVNERRIHATYLLNGGGEQISLETANADIEIRKTGEHKSPGKHEKEEEQE